MGGYGPVPCSLLQVDRKRAIPDNERGGSRRSSLIDASLITIGDEFDDRRSTYSDRRSIYCDRRRSHNHWLSCQAMPSLPQTYDEWLALTDEERDHIKFNSWDAYART